MRVSRDIYDAVIIGGGPAGATCARELARRGRRVVVLERASFPRFHIGESFLPKTFEQIRAQGLLDQLQCLPHVAKFGAEFVLGHGNETSSDFFFSDALSEVESESFNIERAPFDSMLLDAARQAGVEVREGVKVTAVPHLSDGRAVIVAGKEEIEGRCVIDASGQATVLGRLLGTRRVMPDFQNVAYFAHGRKVARRSGRLAGHPTVVMCREGWFWLIPIDEERTSIGLVLDQSFAKRVDVPAHRMLRWGIESCPEMHRRCMGAVLPSTNNVVADFSYTCRPFAGEGYFLIGDAAVFVDPIFSTGVCLGMTSGAFLADRLDAALRENRTFRSVRREYERYLYRSSRPFFTLVRMYYDHSFRELFLHGCGPLSMHRAAIELLAGNVFPAPRWAVRWRLMLFRLFVKLHRYVPLVPRREVYSLEDQPARTDELTRQRLTNELNPERASAAQAGAPVEAAP